MGARRRRVLLKISFFSAVFVSIGLKRIFLSQHIVEPRFQLGHWIGVGLPALEVQAKARSGAFLFGDNPTAADVCLVPQLYNARRYNVPLDDCPTLLRAEANANKMEGFAAAHSDRQQVPA